MAVRAYSQAIEWCHSGELYIHGTRVCQSQAFEWCQSGKLYIHGARVFQKQYRELTDLSSLSPSTPESAMAQKHNQAEPRLFCVDCRVPYSGLHRHQTCVWEGACGASTCGGLWVSLNGRRPLLLPLQVRRVWRFHVWRLCTVD